MNLNLKSLQDTQDFAKKLAKDLKAGDVLALYGDLGAGKTTFTKCLAEALGFDARVQSPTFVVARRYTSTSNLSIKVINHIDLYRMTSESDLTDIGLEELFAESDAITIIEWPEIAESILPKETIVLKFEITNDERTLEIQNLY